MKTLLSERGQVVIPKKIRDALKAEKGDEFEVRLAGEDIVLTPLRKFKAQRWQDYVGISDGIVDLHLKDRKKGKKNVHP